MSILQNNRAILYSYSKCDIV